MISRRTGFMMTLFFSFFFFWLPQASAVFHDWDWFLFWMD